MTTATRGWTSRRNVTEEESPAMRFATQQDARAAAEKINNTPRAGIAHTIYTGAWDCWLVEVRPKDTPYGNAYVLRTDGTVANYH